VTLGWLSPKGVELEVSSRWVNGSCEGNWTPNHWRHVACSGGGLHAGENGLHVYRGRARGAVHHSLGQRALVPDPDALYPTHSFCNSKATPILRFLFQGMTSDQFLPLWPSF
jgi:hypothetical protein